MHAFNHDHPDAVEARALSAEWEAESPMHQELQRLREKLDAGRITFLAYTAGRANVIDFYQGE